MLWTKNKPLIECKRFERKRTVISKMNPLKNGTFTRKRTLWSKVEFLVENELSDRKWTLLSKMYRVGVDSCHTVHRSYNLCRDLSLPRRVLLRSVQFWAFLLLKGAFFCVAAKGNNAFDPLYSWSAFLL